jgi:hypothetical protein
MALKTKCSYKNPIENAGTKRHSPPKGLSHTGIPAARMVSNTMIPWAPLYRGAVYLIADAKQRSTKRGLHIP